jgi:hypothetical protein
VAAKTSLVRNFKAIDKTKLKIRTAAETVIRLLAFEGMD